MATILRAAPSAASIRARDEAEGFASCVNIGDVERLVSALGGVTLLGMGLARRGWTGAALALGGAALLARGATGRSLLYENLGTTTAGKRRAGEGDPDLHRGILVRDSCTVNRTPEECYAFCRDVRNLTRFMDHVEAIQPIDATHSRWMIRSPIGGTLAAECEIFNDRPGALIAWHAIGDSEVRSAAAIRFDPAPGNRGTEVTVEYNFEPPAGLIGVSAAKLLGQAPHQRLRADLRRFKQIMEAGEIATVEGQSTCRSRL